MSYVVDPNNTLFPLDGDDASFAAAELRALKTKLQQTVAGPIVTFTGTADVMLAAVVTTYENGMRISGMPVGANTVTAPTLNGIPIIRLNSDGSVQALAVGDYTALGTSTFVYSANALSGNPCWILFAAVSMAAGYTGFRNLLINGCMRIYQRGSTAPGTYTLDRWIVTTPGGVGGIAQVDQAWPGILSGKALQITGVAGVTATTIEQRIESGNSKHLAGKTVTVQYWVYQNTGAVLNQDVKLNCPNTADNYSGTVSAAATQSVAIPSGVWTFVTKTFTVASIATTGLSLVLSTGPLVATQTLLIAEAQLEAGTIATPFERRDREFEHGLCCWYFQRYNGLMLSGYNGAGGAIYASWMFPKMRISPSIGASGASYSNANTLMTIGGDAGFAGYGATIASTGAGYIQFTLDRNAEI